MEQKYNIELIEEYEDINFYSIHLEGEELSEFENFFEKFPKGCSYDEEIDVVISWLDKISERGALERYRHRNKEQQIRQIRKGLWHLQSPF